MTAPAYKQAILLSSAAGPGVELRHVIRAALRSGLASGAVVPRVRSGTVMPALVPGPEAVGEDAYLGAPVMLQNAASLLSELTFRRPKGRIAAVVRPCEYRALVEISKLKQADLAALLLIGVDCLGAAGPGQRLEAEGGEEAGGAVEDPETWRSRLAAGSAAPAAADREACKICTWPSVEGPAVIAGMIGVPAEAGVLLLAREGDEDAARLLDAAAGESGAKAAGDAEADALLRSRAEALAAVTEARGRARDDALAAWRAERGTFEGLTAAVATCTGCLNCRRACPLCYCRECTFETDLFERGGDRFLARAARKGALRLPSEVVLYHLTRLAHVGLSCVSCGMCEAYCPSDIPLTAMFAALGGEARKVFDYEPGRDPEEPLPLATFREEELSPR